MELFVVTRVNSSADESQSNCIGIFEKKERCIKVVEDMIDEDEKQEWEWDEDKNVYRLIDLDTENESTFVIALRVINQVYDLNDNEDN